MSNSIGNLKNSGLQGNNFPWQLKMLQGLQTIIDGNCCEDTLTVLTTIAKTIEPQKRQVKVSSVTNSGTFGTDCYSASIANVGTAAGTVGGAAFPAGTTLNFDAGVLNNTLGAIAYDATGTTFLITEIQ